MRPDDLIADPVVVHVEPGIEWELGGQLLSGDEKKTWQLMLAFKSEVFVGEFEDQLSIHTTHPERPLITIPIKGRIRGDLEARPVTVFFGFVKPGQTADEDMVIRSRTGTGFTVKSVVADKDVVNLGTPQQRDGTWVVPISLDTSKLGAIQAEGNFWSNRLAGYETPNVSVNATD